MMIRKREGGRERGRETDKQRREGRREGGGERETQAFQKSPKQ